MSIDRVLVTATLDQLTSPGTGSRGGYRNHSHDHIPGSVLRGACAAAWIRRHGLPTGQDSAFADIFEGEGTFGPLHAASTVRVPLSVRVHKYGPGPDCQQLWWDQARGDNATRCPDCEQELIESKGETLKPPARVTRTHAALTPDGVAIDDKLFQTTALASGTQLSGWVTGSAVAALYHQGRPIPRLKLGGNRSTGGAAAITLDPHAAPEPLETCDDALILRMAAPAVFFDDRGFPADRPSPHQLRAALGCGADISAAWTRWTSVGGWHAASGLPKPVERAVAAGSTYLVHPHHTPDPDALDRLRTAGIGARRREGFGALYTTPEPPRPLAYWVRRARPVTTIPGWARLSAHLRARAQRWPPDTATDARLLAAVTKTTAPDQATALTELFTHTDHALYRAILDRIETQ
ncbi:type III-B CRISPR module-associated Cmr3 family protein [Nocardia beijingensis]|uniref:type III-B CRISPR module-associated Cmr3 family protein n=1 Tax=Nocardia beijingensis TaxID=95162 RepID=UPI00344CE16B